MCVLCQGWGLLVCTTLQHMAVSARTSAMVIEGGDVKSPWVPPEVTSLPEGDFIRLSRQCRRLAQLCGARGSLSAPSSHNVFLRSLTIAWNKRVAELTDDESRPDKGRRKDLIDDLPRVIVVTVGAFLDEEGNEVPAHDFKMLSTASVVECPCVMVTPSSLELVRKGVRASLGDAASPLREDTRVALDGCKQVCFSSAKRSLFVKYADQDGRTRVKTVRAQHSDVAAVYEERLEATAVELQAFADSQRVLPAGEGESIAP